MSVIRSELTLLTVITWGILVSGQLAPGTDCIVERTQSPGICRAISECPSVLSDIRNRKSYTRCGFVGKMQIVCCPVPRQTTPTPPPQVINSNSRISERKCDEYKAAIYEYTYAAILAVGGETAKIPIDRCGHKAIPLIVGGEFAKAREFPHMALIGFDSEKGPEWACGGSLISDEYVLTAGHCLYSKFYGEPKYVRLGDLNIAVDTDDARPENYAVSQIIPHPQYNRNSKYNDIALLRLNRKVQLDPYKRPACLPTTFESHTSSAIATGWGHTTWAGQSSSHLQKVILDKFTQSECNASYAYEINRKLSAGIVPATQLCAGSKKAAMDTCQGDSGGPLQVYHQHQYCMYSIIGVTSFGITCGNIGTPGVYTRVYPYLDWIESVVWGRS